MEVLEGHEGPVQAVLALPDGSLLSGGSDATIKLWSGKQCRHTFRGHTDTVRWVLLLKAAIAYILLGTGTFHLGTDQHRFTIK